MKAADSRPSEGAVVQSPAAVAVPESPGFAERARLRRRLRYLRKLRELLLRDLGGFVFDARRFQRPRDDIVEAKLSRLAGVDAELRTLEAALEDRRALRELREPGIGGICDVCGAYYASTARFCSECGSSASARRDFADQPQAASPDATAAVPASAASPASPASRADPPAPAPATGHTGPPTGTSLWSTGALPDQSTPASGVEPVPAPSSGGESPKKEAPGAPPSGGLARPEDESGTPPPMSSGDPLRQR